MSAHRVNEARELWKAGKVEEARALLEMMLKENKGDITIWRAYAETWPKRKDQIRVWEICIRNNPSSQEARQALAELTDKPSKKSPADAYVEAIPAQKKGSGSWLWMFWGGLGVFILIVIGAVFAMLSFLPKDAAEYRHSQPVEYYVYAPKAYSNDHDWPLFVGIHGSGGTGLDCWNLWQAYAEREGFILLCPSIPDAGGGFYQDVGESTVWSAIGEVRKQYRVSGRMFFSGFSAGAFFVQGFTYHYPQSVSGLSILSSGNYIGLPPQAANIPVLVVIGGSDDPYGVQGSRDFVGYLEQNGFNVQYEVLPGVGHRVTNKGINLTIDLFRQTVDE